MDEQRYVGVWGLEADSAAGLLAEVSDGGRGLIVRCFAPQSRMELPVDNARISKGSLCFEVTNREEDWLLQVRLQPEHANQLAASLSTLDVLVFVPQKSPIGYVGGPLDALLGAWETATANGEVTRLEIGPYPGGSQYDVQAFQEGQKLPVFNVKQFRQGLAFHTRLEDLTMLHYVESRNAEEILLNTTIRQVWQRLRD